MDVLKIYARIIDYLPVQLKRKFYFYVALMIFGAGVETAILGGIAIYISAIADTDSFLSSRYVSYIKIFTPTSVITDKLTFITFLGIVITVSVIFKNILQLNLAKKAATLSANVESYFGCILLSGYFNKSYEWHMCHNSADLVQAITWRQYLGRGALQPVMQSFSDIFLIFLLLLAVVIMNPSISFMILLALGGSSYIISTWCKPRLNRLSAQCRDYERTLNIQSTTAIHAIKDVKIMGREGYFYREFLSESLRLANCFGKAKFMSKASPSFMEMTGFTLLTTSICAASFLAEQSPAKLTGTISLLAVTAWRVLPALNRILTSFALFRQHMPYVKHELYLLKDMAVREQTEALHPPCPINKLAFQQAIRLMDVSFTYAGSSREVLYKINLTIPHGKTVGIIGKSGAGKSTLINLLIGLLSPTSGTITIDDIPLSQQHSSNWRHNLGYVPQSPYIVDGTIAENIAFGLPATDIDLDRVRIVAQMAAIDFVSDLNQGLHTPIGERGVLLSGGQKQRIAIARALYNAPDVLFFDEATSALDSSNENAILNTIYGLKGAATIVIIAHRLATVANCDIIIWIDKGTIRLIGAPETVLPQYESAAPVLSDESKACGVTSR